MFSTSFWKGALERAFKSAAQALILVWPIADGLLNLWQVDPVESLGVALGAAVLSLLTSVASLAAGPPESPSLVHETPEEVR